MLGRNIGVLARQKLTSEQSNRLNRRLNRARLWAEDLINALEAREQGKPLPNPREKWYDKDQAIFF